MHLNVIQENLAMLYLRLNGYFVSGFIIHTPGNSVKTQLDVLALRFPYNSEPEREIPPSPYLQTSSDRTDFLICEVKSGPSEPQFNDSLRQDDSAIRSMLRWIGAFAKEEIDGLVGPVMQLLSASASSQESGVFRTILGPRQHQVRAVLFAPDKPNPGPTDPIYVSGEELIGYIWSCLRPEKPRPECATRYDFGLWGELEPIVRVFKDAKSKPSMKDICDKLFCEEEAESNA
jgi:hypothetical protein